MFSIEHWPAVEEYEQRTGKLAEQDLGLEFAVPKVTGDDCQNCRALFGRDREQAEAYARENGGVVELRLVTPWRPA